MRTMKNSLKYRLAAIALGTSATMLFTTGCGTNFSGSAALPTTVTGQALQGSVHGGQQPVTGAAIQLYATNTAGYGSVSYALLTTTVATTTGGNFSITGDYTCPSATSMVYITATGGNPGGTANNPNLALMAALGQCGNLSAATQVVINELTTVGAVYALSPFMTGYTAVGTTATNAAGLTNAFAASGKLVNSISGTTPGSSLPSGAVLPISELNTLADIVASCVNSSGGTAGDNSTCGNLFSLTTVGTSVPTDTIGALLSIAKNPGRNVSQLLALSSATSPFQPMVSSATDFTVSIKYKTGGFNAPSASALDANNNLWVTNAGSNSVTLLANTGAPATGSPYVGAGLNAPAGVAIDQSGNAWVTNRLGNSLSAFTPAGVGTADSVTGLSAPTGIAIDGLGVLWITDSQSNAVNAVVTSGTTVQSTTAYSAGGINHPVAVAINPH